MNFQKYKSGPGLDFLALQHLYNYLEKKANDESSEINIRASNLPDESVTAFFSELRDCIITSTIGVLLWLSSTVTNCCANTVCDNNPSINIL